MTPWDWSTIWQNLFVAAISAVLAAAVTVIAVIAEGRNTRRHSAELHRKATIKNEIREAKQRLLDHLDIMNHKLLPVLEACVSIGDGFYDNWRAEYQRLEEADPLVRSAVACYRLGHIDYKNLAHYRIELIKCFGAHFPLTLTRYIVTSGELIDNDDDFNDFIHDESRRRAALERVDEAELPAELDEHDCTVEERAGVALTLNYYDHYLSRYKQLVNRILNHVGDLLTKRDDELYALIQSEREDPGEG